MPDCFYHDIVVILQIVYADNKRAGILIGSAGATIDDLVVSNDIVVAHTSCTASNFHEPNTVYGGVVHDFIVINGRPEKFKCATIESIVIA